MGVLGDSGVRDTLLIIAILLALAGLGVAIVAMAKLSRLHRSYALLEAAEGRETFVDVVARTREDFGALEDHVAALNAELVRTRRELSVALRHVAVVRYDAFGDMGGRFSFSAAMLDDQGDGIVLTSIHGRSETRSYIKGLAQGASDIELSPEELQAVEIAKGAQS